MKFIILGLFCLVLAGCGAVTSTPTSVQADRPAGEFFESEDYFVIVAQSGDTTQSLATKFLGDANKDWMIEDYNGTANLAAGQQVAIPKRPWNLSGVTSTGYQLVPILVYHDLAAQAKGRMVMGARGFEEQMRYLKTHGYRVITLKEYLEFVSLQRQLPKKSVLITFDDGYRSFSRYGYPVLKELGFSATLFIYTDYVGAGGNAFTWPELKKLSDEEFFIQAHSKSHGDMVRARGEGAAEYDKRLEANPAASAVSKISWLRSRHHRLSLRAPGRCRGAADQGTRLRRGFYRAAAGQPVVCRSPSDSSDTNLSGNAHGRFH